ncbi:MAG: hypothetical protein JST00_17655 [Deltaproteobacteria bacterium]|nr:hypothetical protein [Deltaproteobacteria bacterium]
MLHRGARIFVAAIALSAGVGCGSEASLVGAECSDGLMYVDNQCVSPIFKRYITPGDPPPLPGDERDDGRRPGPTFELPPGPARPVGPPLVTPPDGSLDPGVVPPLVPPSEPPTGPTDPPVTPPVDPNVGPPVVPPVTPPIDPTIGPPIAPPVTPPVTPPLTCAAPLVLCSGACISVTSDPRNCGACGKICPSNICVAGECQGATPGDVVLIGHSYGTAVAGSSQAKILLNALEIATTNPIRILSYEAGAAPEEVSAVTTLATTSLASIGRGTAMTVSTTPADLASPSLASSFDVVIVHGFVGDAAALGTQWRDSLGTFTQKGGIVVALDDGSRDVPTVLSSSMLLQVSGHTVRPSSTHLVVAAATDAVGTQVLSPYAPYGSPVTFQGLAAEGPDLTWVLRERITEDDMGDAVVVHRIVR